MYKSLSIHLSVYIEMIDMRDLLQALLGHARTRLTRVLADYHF